MKLADRLQQRAVKKATMLIARKSYKDRTDMILYVKPSLLPKALRHKGAAPNLEWYRPGCLTFAQVEAMGYSRYAAVEAWLVIMDAWHSKEIDEKQWRRLKNHAETTDAQRIYWASTHCALYQRKFGTEESLAALCSPNEYNVDWAPVHERQYMDRWYSWGPGRTDKYGVRIHV